MNEQAKMDGQKVRIYRLGTQNKTAQSDAAPKATKKNAPRTRGCASGRRWPR